MFEDEELKGQLRPVLASVEQLLPKYETDNLGFKVVNNQLDIGEGGGGEGLVGQSLQPLGAISPVFTRSVF